MNHLATVFALSAVVLLFGCGGVPAPAPMTSPPTSPTTPSPGALPVPNIAGNWQFSATSAVPGRPQLTFTGGISQAISPFNAALHVGGSNCFNQLTTMSFTGAVTADSATLTSTVIDGQVVTFTGNFTNTTFTGTYSINGGCDDGDQGSVTGNTISFADGDAWSGTFTSSTQTKFSVGGDFDQSTNVDSAGSFGIAGTATFDTPCFSASTLTPGSFPSGSFIMGTLVSLEIKTNNGTLTFAGTLDPAGSISGTYTVSGGTCDQTGTAYLVLTGQWDY